MAQTKAQLVVGLNVNASAPASALQIDASGNVNLDSNTLYVDATNNRVGIGTSSPGTALHLGNSSTLRINNPDGTRTLDLFNDANNAEIKSSVDPIRINAFHSSGYVRFDTNNTERVRITSAGNVGIGTTTVNRPLVVFNDSVAALSLNNTTTGTAGGDGFQIQLVGSDGYVFNYEAAPVIFGTAATERARIDSSGRLLVGTSSARSMLGFTPGIQSEATSFSQGTLSLTMNSTAGNAYPILCFARSGGTTLGSNAVVSNGDIVGKMFFVAADGTDMDSSVATIEAVVDGTPGSNDLPGRLVFSTTADGSNIPTERMRIANTGTVSFYYGQRWEDRGTSKGVFTPDFRLYNSTSNTFAIDNYTVGVQLVGGATAWSSTSDERQKTNLESIENGLSKVAALRAVTGRYLTDAEDVSRSFLIAQDVQAVLPEAVSVESDEDATLSLRYTEVIPLLVAALKESKERIEQLEARLTAAGIE